MRCMAEGHIHTCKPMPQVNLAFSQTCSMASISWGVALVFTQYVVRRGFVLHWIERAGSSLIFCELIGGYEQIRWRLVGRGQEPSRR